MKIYNPDQFMKEDSNNYDKYKEVIERYGISKIFYIENKFDIMDYEYLETDETKLKVSKPLIETLPFKKYFSLILTAKSRSNVNEPYYFYKIETLDKLRIDILKDNGEIVFENDGNEEQHYIEQENKLSKEQFLKELEDEEDEVLKNLIEDEDDNDLFIDEEYNEEGDYE